MNKILLALAVALLPAAAVAEPMRFEQMFNGGNCGECTWIQATGEIMPDTADVFRKFLVEFKTKNKYDPSHNIRLNSPGGNLAGGIALGEALRAGGYTTGVGGGEIYKESDPPHTFTTTAGICASACAYAFLGGVTRTLDEDAKLGFHQFYSEKMIEAPTEKLFTGKDLDDQQKIMAFLVFYLVRMGVDPRVLVVAANTKAQDIRYIGGEVAKQLKVTYQAAKYQPWRLEVFKGGVVAITESADGLRSMTASCSKRYGPNVLLVRKEAPADLVSWYKQCTTVNPDNPDETFRAFGVDIPPKNAVMSTVQDRVSVRFLLPNRSAAISSNWLSFDGSMACMSEDLAGTEENQIPAIRVAMQNCIQD